MTDDNKPPMFGPSFVIDSAIHEPRSGKSALMNQMIAHARQLVESIPQDKQAVLAAAHERYMYFAGVYTDTSPEFSAKRINEDRARFAHLLKFTDDGRPSLSDERCAEFMAAVTGLPRDWCLAWDEVEFIETHGEDIYAKQDRKKQIVEMG